MGFGTRRLAPPAAARAKGGRVKTRAAVLWDRNKDWSVEEIELDPPKAGEVAGRPERQRPVPLR